MTFEPKYQLGGAVVAISQSSIARPPERCTACEGEGSCVLRGERYDCPKCDGKKTTRATGWGWVVTERGVVRYIRCEATAGKTSYAYMFTETGTGTVYRESELWPPNDAHAECDRRNASVAFDEEASR